jgi:hypothetical protein
MCNVLKKKLDIKNIKYDVNEDVDEMIRLGFMTAPVLKVDDKIFNFGDAVKFVDQYEGE